jgi:hypothetical protein
MSSELLPAPDKLGRELFNVDKLGSDQLKGRTLKLGSELLKA